MATRQIATFEIFHDPTLPANSYPTMNKPRPQLQPSAMPLQPIKNPSTHPDVVLEPPQSAPQQPSPLKAQALPSPQKINYNNLNFIPIPPPAANAVFTDSPTKKPPPQPARPYYPAPIQQPLFTTFNSNFDTYEKETYRPATSRNDNFADFPEPSYARKQSLRRSYSDVVHTTGRPFEKGRPEDDSIVELPEPDDMPLVEDDGSKPSLSYAQMIGMAILRAPHRRLTLSQIYDWISSTFAFYREDTKQGWHNSIRHNLSLNKAFKKQERPKGDAGKGSYWVIEPGMESTFIRDKPRKGNTVANITVHPHLMRSESQPIAQPLAEALAPNPWLGQTKPSPRMQPTPALPELSSDATLPASDPALNDDDDVADFELHSLPQAPLSSPPQAMNSSPPTAALGHRRTGSSPTRAQNTAAGKGRKRTLAAMDDSGYFSSIESSAFRPNKAGIVLTSEIDLEPARKKRGRAEEEIIRIRSSSHDVTPSHRRFRSLGSEDILSSSPIRLAPSTKLNPMTPSVVFKKPMRPPPSVSPNTQLRNHRKALQDFTNSPIKSLGLWGHEFDSYSPAFKVPSVVMQNAFDEHFEVYSDIADSATPATPGPGSSPLKRSALRPSLSRASTTANILSDIPASNGRYNAKTPSKGPMLKPTPKIYAAGSPLKASSTNPAIFEDPEEIFDFGMFADENSDDGEGVDIGKGFQKIGGASMLSAKGTSPSHTHPSNKAPARPPLGTKSFTSRF